MLADVCGVGTYMCLQFFVCLWVRLLVSVGLLRDVMELDYAHILSLSLLLFRGIALMVF